MCPRLASTAIRFESMPSVASGKPGSLRLSTASATSSGVRAEPEHRREPVRDRERQESARKGDHLQREGGDEERRAAQLEIGDPIEPPAECEARQQAGDDAQQEDHQAVTASMGGFAARWRSSAATTRASNCVQLQRRSSASAASVVLPRR